MGETEYTFSLIDRLVHNAERLRNATAESHLSFSQPREHETEIEDRHRIGDRAKSRFGSAAEQKRLRVRFAGVSQLLRAPIVESNTPAR